MRVKMSKPPPPAPTAGAIGPCPTVIKIVGRPGTGSLPSTIAPPDHLNTDVDVRSTLARNAFEDSLGDPDMEWAVHQGKPLTIELRRFEAAADNTYIPKLTKHQ